MAEDYLPRIERLDLRNFILLQTLWTSWASVEWDFKPAPRVK